MCLEVRHDNVPRFPGTRKVCFVSENGDGIEASTEQHGIDDSQRTEMRTGMDRRRARRENAGGSPLMIMLSNQ
jgi:hypothetical protein